MISQPVELGKGDGWQLEQMKVGQSVSVRVDAVPGRDFNAHIESFQVGTGSRFTLLPPENATGNFVKVVQRVPVTKYSCAASESR